MGIEPNIDFSQVATIFEAVFEKGEPVVKDEYSIPDMKPKVYSSADEMLEEIKAHTQDSLKGKTFTVYYPEMAGFVYERKKNLNPDSSGHHFRYIQEGWGLIRLIFLFDHMPKVTCWISCNSQKRAHKWFPTYPEYQDPDLWNWTEVQKHERRIKRVLRKLEKAFKQNL